MNETIKEEIAAPYAAGLERINQIIQSLYENKAYEHSVTYSDINKWTGINSHTIANNIKFLRTFGLITTDSKQSEMKLTDDGKNYGQAILFSDNEKQKEVLSKLCDLHLHDLIQFCKLKNNSQDGLKFDDIFRQIAVITNTPKIDGNTKKGIETIIQIFTQIGLLDDKFLPEKNKIETVKNLSVSRPKKTKISGKRQPTPSIPPSTNIPNQPQYQNISHERLGVDIKITIDAKDSSSFDNTLNFLKNLSVISKKDKVNISVSKELENFQGENNSNAGE